MSKMFTVTLLAAAFVLSAPLLLPVEARPQDDPTSGSKERPGAALLATMHETAELLVRIRMEEYAMGSGGFRELISAQDQLIAVEMKMADSAADRLAVRKQHLELARSTETMVKTRHEAGRARQGDLLERQVRRMNVELSMLDSLR